MGNLNSFNSLYADYSNLIGNRMNVVTERHVYNIPRSLSDSLCAVTGFDVDRTETRACHESYERDMIEISKWTHNVMCDDIASWCDAATPYLVPDTFAIKLTLTEAAHIAGCLYAWLNKEDGDYDECSLMSFAEYHHIIDDGDDVDNNICIASLDDIKALTEIFPLLDLNEDEDTKDKLQDWLLV